MAKYAASFQKPDEVLHLEGELPMSETLYHSFITLKETWEKREPIDGRVLHFSREVFVCSRCGKVINPLTANSLNAAIEEPLNGVEQKALFFGCVTRLLPWAIAWGIAGAGPPAFVVPPAASSEVICGQGSSKRWGGDKCGGK